MPPASEQRLQKILECSKTRAEDVAERILASKSGDYFEI
jgi:hypothetical protein